MKAGFFSGVSSEEGILILKKKTLGFTLIEVLIVVVIIAVLASLIIPRIVAAPEKAKLAEAYNTLGVLIRAQKAYADLTGGTPLDFDCEAPPDNCTATALTSLGLAQLSQRDFRYKCGSSNGVNYHCQAFRQVLVAGKNPNVYQYYIYPDSPSNEGKWHCERGYVTADGGTATFSSKGCRPDW